MLGRAAILGNRRAPRKAGWLEAAAADPAVLGHLKGQCWIIDPLDGTANFAEGKEPFGIIVALADGGEAVAGWIYDPN